MPKPRAAATTSSPAIRSISSRPSSFAGASRRPTTRSSTRRARTRTTSSGRRSRRWRSSAASAWRRCGRSWTTSTPARRKAGTSRPGCPSLPFTDAAFDLALSSHFLFLYAEQLGEDFHRAAITELCRVAREVRIFPLLALGGKPSPYVNLVADQARAAGHDVVIERVPYEFQRGGNEMMRVRTHMAARKPFRRPVSPSPSPPPRPEIEDGCRSAAGAGTTQHARVEPGSRTKATAGGQNRGAGGGVLRSSDLQSLPCVARDDRAVGWYAAARRSADRVAGPRAGAAWRAGRLAYRADRVRFLQPGPGGPRVCRDGGPASRPDAANQRGDHEGRRPGRSSCDGGTRAGRSRSQSGGGPALRRPAPAGCRDASGVPRHRALRYADAIEWRVVEGDLGRPGPATVWTRCRMPIVRDSALTGLERVLAVVDAANGISAELPIAGGCSCRST